MPASFPSQDWLSAPGAERLAEKIARYWIERGYANVKTFVISVATAKSATTIYCVRSNLSGGLPPRRAADGAQP